jgi:hypothetical protein
VQTGFWQNVREKLTASVSTRRSRFGVTAASFPTCPRTSPRHWSGLKMMMLGRERRFDADLVASQQWVDGVALPELHR